DWLGEKRDWCISRQLWWGHRIPVWTRPKWEGESYPQGAVHGYLHKWVVLPAFNGDEQRARQAMEDIYCVYSGDHLHLCIRTPEVEKAVGETLGRMGYTQETDVLDTWFSSALWPHSTLGWPGPVIPESRPDRVAPDWEKLRPSYYPTSVLVTNRDIITLWVARMVLTGLFNVGEIPFHHVYIHPKVMDAFGEGMSKSKGVDPLDIIDIYGTDALRYGVVKLATETQDSRMPVSNLCPHCGAEVAVKQEHMYMRTRKITCPQCKKPFRPGGPWPEPDPELPTAKQGSNRFEEGRNFANKLWNATRFILMNLDGYTPGPLKVEELPTEDRWLLSRLATTTKAVTEALEGYHFSEVARLVYDFV